MIVPVELIDWVFTMGAVGFDEVRTFTAEVVLTLVEAPELEELEPPPEELEPPPPPDEELPPPEGGGVCCWGGGVEPPPDGGGVGVSSIV